MRARAWFLRHAGKAGGLVALGWLAIGIGVVAGRWTPRVGWLGWVAASVVAWLLLAVWARWQREKVIREAPLPQLLKRKLRETYPHLSGKDVDLVERGLRQFFLACLRSKRRFVAMPSQVVDAMWHEFILHTRAYRDWCELSLGWFLHHTPALVLGGQAHDNDGLRRAWYWACRDESIYPQRPTRLPLLFALDAKLGIANGFHYVPDCRDVQRKSVAGGDGGAVYCGTGFSDGNYSGDPGGFGGMESASGGWGGDGDSGGGGDGGGGCGGGGD